MKKQITIATVLDVRKKLESLPRIDNAHRKVTTREALQVLKKQITDLRNKGYTFVQIAEGIVSERNRGEGIHPPLVPQRRKAAEAAAEPNRVERNHS